MFVDQGRWQDGVACRTFFPSYSRPCPVLHPCTPTFQLLQGSCSIITPRPEFSPSLDTGSSFRLSTWSGLFPFKSPPYVSLFLTMFLSFLLLLRAYLKKQPVFTAFLLNLLCRLVSTLIPLKLLWQTPMVSMLLKPGGRVSEFCSAGPICHVPTANHSGDGNALFLWVPSRESLPQSPLFTHLALPPQSLWIPSSGIRQGWTTSTHHLAEFCFVFFI